MYRFQELITKELDNFTKIFISIIFIDHELPDHHSLNFGGNFPFP